MPLVEGPSCFEEGGVLSRSIGEEILYVLMTGSVPISHQGLACDLSRLLGRLTLLMCSGACCDN